MKLSRILTVFRKDSLDISRDRKTLMFMVLLPTVAMPVLLWAVSRFILAEKTKTAQATIRVAATEPVRALVENRAENRIQAIGIRLFDLFEKVDPERTAALRRKQTEAARDLPGLLRVMASKKPPEGGVWKEIQDLSRELFESLTKPGASDQLDEFDRGVFREVIALARLLGQTEWIDPADLPPPDPAFSTQRVVERLHGEDLAVRVAAAIHAKRLEACLVLDGEDLERTLADPTASLPLRVLYDKTLPLSEEAWGRLRPALESVRDSLLGERLRARELTWTFVAPVDVREENLAPEAKVFAATIGGFLPYLVIIFCFTGALYPAFDIGAGEKERSTLETLLLAPATRLEIATGKFLVVFVAALIAGLLSTASMAVTFRYGVLPEELSERLAISFETPAILLSILLILPLSAAFAAMLLSLSVYARSFKEAQSYSTPLQFVLVIPAMASTIPTLELTPILGSIPIVNASILLREFCKGEYPMGYFALAFASSVVLAVAAILFNARWFEREDVIFRN
jgi:sodium transport system permease protein